MTPVELLREAAKVMRERARAATPGPWVVADRGAAYGGSEEIANLVSEAGRAVANAGGGGRAFLLADADHAASWHPAVALAVADWLDREARRVGSHAITTYEVREDWWAYSCHTCGVGGSTSGAGLAAWHEAHVSVRLVADDAALTVARAYLGGGES